MRVEQRKLLCAMHDVDGAVDVQGDLARRPGVAGAIDVDQGVAHRRYFAPVGRVLPARHGGLRAQIRAAVRKSAAGQFEAGIKAQPVKIVAVLVAARDRQDAGAQDVGHAMLHKMWIARMGDQAGKRVGDPQAALGGGEQRDTAIGRDAPAVERGEDFLARDGWEMERDEGIFGHGGCGSAWAWSANRSRAFSGRGFVEVNRLGVRRDVAPLLR
jgi:hypothetical protein